jgi:ATP-binding cassette subfamily B protein
MGQTYAIKQALDLAIVPATPRVALGVVLGLFLGLMALEASLRFAHGYLMQSTGQRVVHDLRLALMDHLARAPMPYFDDNPVGRLLTRATSDLESIGELFSSGAIAAIGDAVTVAGVATMMLWLDLRLATVVLMVTPVLAAVVVTFRRRMKAAYETARARMAKMTAYLAEALAGLEVLKVTAQEPRAAAEYAAINGEYRDAYWWSNLHEATLYSTVELLGFLTVATLLWTAGGGIDKGMAEGGID